MVYRFLAKYVRPSVRPSVRHPVTPPQENSKRREISLKPLPTLTRIPRESIADTNTSSLGRLSASTKPCASSYATHPHTPRYTRYTPRTYSNNNRSIAQESIRAVWVAKGIQ
ncbi:unnamed protein product, partial [Laminaria digitata]